MDITIRGNRRSYQLYKQIENIEITLKGNMTSNLSSPVSIIYDSTEIVFPNALRFYKYAEKIKGADLEKIVLLSREFELPSQFIKRLSRLGEIEVSLFKSIFLIYNWVEIAFTDAYAVSLDDRVYNSLILDYNPHRIDQKDIYFINYKYLDSSFKNSIKKLVELNLLVSAYFDTNFGIAQSYFVPLIKPGVSREYFKVDTEKDGNITYDIWKSILSDREYWMKNWFNNRR